MYMPQLSYTFIDICGAKNKTFHFWMIKFKWLINIWKTFCWMVTITKNPEYSKFLCNDLCCASFLQVFFCPHNSMLWTPIIVIKMYSYCVVRFCFQALSSNVKAMSVESFNLLLSLSSNFYFFSSFDDCCFG